MKRIRRFFILAAAVCAALYCYSLKGGAVSPGLEVLRSETKLVKCCVNGGRVSFTAEEFETLTGTELEYLTVRSLPSVKDGVLKLAGVDVVKGQKISASGVQLLKFVPASGFTGTGVFTFTVSSDRWASSEISCEIKFSETVNFAPIAVSEGFNTYENVSVTKRLSAYDPDGDELTYVIERYPAGGTLVIDGGEATYTPIGGFTGADSFVYRVLDGYGNKSEAATASVTVSGSKSGIYFADMKGDSAHLSAILAAENDIMTYTLIGDSYYFTPDEKVSRIDFAVMLVSAAGIKVPDKAYPTDIFTDTSSQSREKRLYLEAAVTSGLIDADTETGAFRPDEAISVSDAVAMTEKALSEDSAAISSAYYENADRELTKKDAAVVLSCLVGDALTK